MKKEFLKISVVTPSYNQGQFLEETILSVINQNYPNLEYIIIDGGSNDNSVEIIKKYEKKLKYWISEPDEGQTHAINKGLKLSTGDIVCYLNSDDLLLPNTLKYVSIYFSNNIHTDCLYGCTIMIDHDGKELLRRHDNPFNYNMLLYGINYIQQPSTFWRKRIIERVGLFDENLIYNMDYEYWIRMGYNDLKLDYTETFLSKYRLHTNSKSIINSNTIQKERKTIRRKYSKIYKYDKIDFVVFPIMNLIMRMKRQSVKIRKYKHIEIIPGKLIYWYFKKIKKQFRS